MANVTGAVRRDEAKKRGACHDLYPETLDTNLLTNLILSNLIYSNLISVSNLYTKCIQRLYEEMIHKDISNGEKGKKKDTGRKDNSPCLFQEENALPTTIYSIPQDKEDVIYRFRK